MRHPLTANPFHAPGIYVVANRLFFTLLIEESVQDFIPRLTTTLVSRCKRPFIFVAFKQYAYVSSVCRQTSPSFLLMSVTVHS